MSYKRVHCTKLSCLCDIQIFLLYGCVNIPCYQETTKQAHLLQDWIGLHFFCILYIIFHNQPPCFHSLYMKMGTSPLSFKLDWIRITFQPYYEMLNALYLGKYIHKKTYICNSGD